MKSIEFIKRVLTEAKVAPDVIGAIIVDDKLPDALPDEAVQAYEKNLFTFDRAQVDPELTKVMNSKAYKSFADGWDKDFNAFAETLDADTATAIKNEKFTRKKWELIANAVKSAGAGADPEGKVKGARKEIELLHTQLREKEAAMAIIKAEADSKVSDFKRDYLVSEKLATLDVVDHMKGYPNLLKNQLFESINKKGIIFTIENDQLVPRRKTETGELVDVYEANTKVGVDDLIKKELQDFIKKSNGAGGNNGNQRTGSTPPASPKSGMTLEEMNRLKVAENFAKLKSN